MDAIRFDDLTKYVVLTSAEFRRRLLLRLLAGGAIAALAPQLESAAAKKRKCPGGKRRCGKRCRPKTDCCPSAQCAAGLPCGARTCSGKCAGNCAVGIPPCGVDADGKCFCTVLASGQAACVKDIIPVCSPTGGCAGCPAGSVCEPASGLCICDGGVACSVPCGRPFPPTTIAAKGTARQGGRHLIERQPSAS
jgi:hypothetical protein